jgi:hypothetical protein
MKVSTEIDNNFGYEKITQLVDNIPLRTRNLFASLLIFKPYCIWISDQKPISRFPSLLHFCQSDYNLISQLLPFTDMLWRWRSDGNPITNHMLVTLCTIQWKWRLRDYESVVILLCTLQVIQLVITVFFVSLYIHDIRSLSCDP